MPPDRRRPGLVIFDCDGVLVASEPITNRVLAELLNTHGAALTPESCAARFTGTSRHAVTAYRPPPITAQPLHGIYPFPDPAVLRRLFGLR